MNACTPRLVQLMWRAYCHNRYRHRYNHCHHLCNHSQDRRHELMGKAFGQDQRRDLVKEAFGPEAFGPGTPVRLG